MDSEKQQPENKLSPQEEEVSKEIKPQNKNVLKSKFFVLFILFLVMAALLIGGFLLGTSYLGNKSASEDFNNKSLTPTVSDKMPGLNTYTNEKYNYSIDYYNNWRFRESPDSKSGAAFSPLSKPNEYENETISISAYNKTLGYSNLSFEEYVKIAATKEIQGYNKLVSINKITTLEGVVGYKTTWMVQSIGPGGSSESLPITYFELPNNKNMLIRISLDSKEDLGVYEKMITTVKFIKQDKAIEAFLDVPEYGIKILLADIIKDAYVVEKDGYKYLKVKSLDSEPQCKSDDTAFAALGKVGKDEINQMTNEKYSNSANGKIIGDYYYYISLAQYSCAEKPENIALLEKIRTAFSEASSNIQSL